MSIVTDNLELLFSEGKLDKPVVLWGIGRQTEEVYEWLAGRFGQGKVVCIIDNFKYTFMKEFRSIPVWQPSQLTNLQKDSFVVLLAVNYSNAIRKHLAAYDITDGIYNLRNLCETVITKQREVNYHFTDRSLGKENLCYVLAGYDPMLWDNTLKRIALFRDPEVDYCIVSSGKHVKELEEIASENGWSYLYMEKNQVCVIQNLVVELHPCAKYIIKLDEDIFVGSHFFKYMIQEFHRIEDTGEYRIGCMVPVIPLNCCGYVSFLKWTGKLKEYEKRFGRAYRSRFSAVFRVVETAEFLWDVMGSFDDMAEYFLKNGLGSEEILCCYFNIGCIMFTRERWLMMGKWPENMDESGMGKDEWYILQDNMEKDMPMYEAQGILAGHLAFGHQKQRMREYYYKHPEIFSLRSEELQSR